MGMCVCPAKIDISDKDVAKTVRDLSGERRSVLYDASDPLIIEQHDTFSAAQGLESFPRGCFLLAGRVAIAEGVP